MKRLVAAALVLSACSTPRKQEAATLGGEIGARVGDTEIPISVVQSVAEARGTDARVAADALIEDALAAKAARDRGLDKSTRMAWILTATEARWVAERLARESQAQGEATDVEVESLTKVHWREFDLPEQVIVVHAVVLRGDKATPESNARAREKAVEIQRACANAPTMEAFKAEAEKVPREELTVRVENLPAFVDDGRVSEGSYESQMDETFAHAAFELRAPGGTSGVVETKFGWHVIRLIERRPARRVPFEERRAAFRAEVHSLRAHRAKEALLEAQRSRHGVDISPAAAALMAEVRIAAP